MGFGDVVLYFTTAGLNLQWVAFAAAAGPSSLSVWIVAFFVMAIPLAFSMVEMSSRYPQEGGMYVWSKRAFGDFAGFMTGWTYWMSNLPYFPGVLYFAAGNALYIGGDGWRRLVSSPSYMIVAALLGLALGMVPNLLGLQFGKWISNVGAFARWAATLPLITLMYLLGTICVLVALPPERLSGLQGPIDAIEAAASRLGLDTLTPVAAFLITLSALGSVGAWLASVARLPFVAGLDHYLPDSFGRLHPKWRTPHVALLTLGATIGVCIVLGQAGQTVKGAYDILVSMTVICTLIPFLLVFASMIRLQREPA